MAWTDPAAHVFTTGEIVTAATMNTYIKNNLLETAVAKFTTAGDLFVGTGATAGKRLAMGAALKALGVNSGATDLAYLDSLASLLTAQGDLPYASAANTPARLAKGTALQIFRMNAGATAPEWADALSDVVKSADTSRNTTTTLADDPHLTMSVGTGFFAWDARLYYDGQGGDFKGNWVFSGTQVAPSQMMILSKPAAGSYGLTDAVITTVFTGEDDGVGAMHSMVFFGVMEVTVAGTFKLQWAQNTSSANPTTLYAPSYINLVKIS